MSDCSPLKVAKVRSLVAPDSDTDIASVLRKQPVHSTTRYRVHQATIQNENEFIAEDWDG